MEQKVSLILPLYNRATLIQETLNSLYNQTYRNWEAIIVDDGSTDNSYSVVEEQTKRDTRVKLFKRENSPKGAPRCRNLGIKKATGKYLIFLDSDDLLAPYCIEERVEAFSKNPNHDFLVFQGAFFDTIMADTAIYWNKFTEENDLNRFLRGDIVWQTSAPIWKKTSLVSNKIYFYEYALSGQDWEFHLKALVKELKYKKINNLPDYFVRRGLTNKSDRISSAHGSIHSFKNRLNLYAYTLKFLNLNNTQKNEIIHMMKNEFFNVYHKINNFKELIEILDEIKLSINKKNIMLFKYNFKVKFLLAKLTDNKSHYFFYYLKKMKNASNSNYYRYKMSKEELVKCQNKLAKHSKL